MMAFAAEMKRDPAKRSAPFIPSDFEPKPEPQGLTREAFLAYEKTLDGA